MSDTKPDGGVKLGFDSSTDQTKQTVPAAGKAPVQTEEPNVNNEPYVDKRSVTIALVRNYSKYRDANRASLPKRTDYIGSSVASSLTLSANKVEMDTYMPQLIGLSPTHPDFVLRVKQYFNNIQIKVDDLGRTFDTSFHYYKKSDYQNILDKERAIEGAFSMANRNNLKELKEALKIKITDTNNLEATKCTIGYPINLIDYLMYRHCLLYSDIAKDAALINNDISIRFYFKDDKKEAENLRKLRLETNKAKTNFVQCLADEKLFEAIYIQYCVSNNLPVISSLHKSELDKEVELDKYSVAQPVKFNKLFANKDTKLIGMIENLVARGILIRPTYSQNITTSDGTLIGANMIEAISWFKNVDNVSAVNAYKNQLANI